METVFTLASGHVLAQPHPESGDPGPRPSSATGPALPLGSSFLFCIMRALQSAFSV